MTATTPLHVIEERLAVLNGDRGNPGRAAVRREELGELKALLAKVTVAGGVSATTIAGITADIAAIELELADHESRITTLETSVSAQDIVLFGGSYPPSGEAEIIFDGGIL